MVSNLLHVRHVPLLLQLILLPVFPVVNYAVAQHVNNKVLHRWKTHLDWFLKSHLSFYPSHLGILAKLNSKTVFANRYKLGDVAN